MLKYPRHEPLIQLFPLADNALRLEDEVVDVLRETC